MTATRSTPSVAIVLLAAGTASRMGEGGPHKLLATFDGVPLVRRMALAARGVAPVVVVTGHRHADVEAALAGLSIETVFNAGYRSGIASSIQAGFGAPTVDGADGVLIMLADMPAVSGVDLEALIEAFRRTAGHAVIRASFQGRRGNPVILPRSLLPAIETLQGDVGARAIIDHCGLPVIDVEIGAAAHLDVDTPDAVIAAGGVLGD